MCKLSIIIPMYNSFDLMEKGLDILEKQNNNEIEVIVIDDCSSDSSFLSIKEYAEKSMLDIKYYKNKENSGPGVSRNNGINKANGEYITFIDSDDYFSEVFLSKVWKYLNGTIDCLIFDYNLISNRGKNLGSGKSIGNEKVKCGYVDSKKAFVYTYGSTWGKIYKKSIIDEYHIEYGKFFRNEDMPFTKTALAMCNKIFYLPEKLYNYVQIENSLMHTADLTSEKNCQSAFELLKSNLQKEKIDEELKAIELREVLNNSVLIMVGKKISYKKINAYVKTQYTWSHINNKYFKEYPGYVKITSLLIYFRAYPVVSLVWRYKEWKKKKTI